MKTDTLYWITCFKTGAAPVTYSAVDVRNIETKFASDVASRLTNPFHSKKPVLLGTYGMYGSAQVIDAYMVTTAYGAAIEYKQRVDPHHAQIFQASHPPLPSAD
jgi:hypothetical protein